MDFIAETWSSIVRLDNIFKAMRGLRIFERFGFNLPQASKTKRENSKVVQEYDEWVFKATHFDWVNTENDGCLSDYKPISELIYLLTNNIAIFYWNRKLP